MRQGNDFKVFEAWRAWPQAEVGLLRSQSAPSVEKLAEVYAFAERWHGDQSRPSGEPYTIHLLETLEVVADYLGISDQEVLAATLLHDVVEDTVCSIEKIKKLFGDRVADLVGWVTKPRPESGEDKRDARVRYLSRFASAPDDVVIIKLADRYSNVQQLDRHPRPTKQRSYYAETVRFFCPLAARLPLFDALFTKWRETFAYLGKDGDEPSAGN